MPCPSHPSWLDHSNYTWRRVQVIRGPFLNFRAFTYTGKHKYKKIGDVIYCPSEIRTYDPSVRAIIVTGDILLTKRETHTLQGASVTASLSSLYWELRCSLVATNYFINFNRRDGVRSCKSWDTRLLTLPSQAGRRFVRLCWRAGPAWAPDRPETPR
jgi:hypothetical protein